MIKNDIPSAFCGAKTYQDYLKSWLWKDKKDWIFYLEEIKDEYGIRTGFLYCEKCKRRFLKNRLTLHHLNYNCIGSERREDLMIVCNNCHKIIHDVH